MFLSDGEVEEDDTDAKKHLGKKKDDGDPKALTQDYLRVGTKGDMALEEVTVDNTEVVGELEREDQRHVEVIKDEEGEGLLKEKCDICGKKVAHIDEHILATHKEDINCQLCDQTFSVANLRWHILKEHCQRKAVECSLCDQKFATKNALKSHIKATHLSETDTCSICHKEYKDLYHHVKFKHDQIRNYECSYCKKKFQAKKLLYNHVQSVHLGEKTNCPDCKKDISVDNFRRHVKEFHEGIRKPCPQCGKEFGMANQRRHIRQVHNNESTKCPDCGKAITISNLNKHIQSVHNKLKKVCGLCNEEVPYSSISVHRRRVHNMGKPVDDVTPRGPNLKLRKINQEKFDEVKVEDFTHTRNRGWVKEEGEEDIEEVGIDAEGLENLDLEVAEDGKGTGQDGETNFTWVEIMSEPVIETGLWD